MKIIINTGTTHQGGGVQVARSFIEECRHIAGHDFHVVLGQQLSELVVSKDYPGNFTFYPIGYRPASGLKNLQRSDRFFKKIEAKIKPDVVFTTSGPAYWRPKAPHLVGYNLPHYIYRDSPYYSQFTLPQKLKWDLKGKLLKHCFIRESDAYVVQTEDVNRRLRQWLQTERVYTVGNTYSRHYERPLNGNRNLPDRREDEFRLLTLSAWYPHKNLEIIPRVVEFLPEWLVHRVRFVLTLPEELFRDNFPPQMRDGIINIGPVRPEEGPALYNECDALFLPTLLECFSASYAEAMKMEKPIVTSDLGFAHTVCGDAALYVDPMNPVDIAGKINDLLENPFLRKKLVEEGIKQQKAFVSAEKRAEKYLEICKELADAGKNNR